MRSSSERTQQKRAAVPDTVIPAAYIVTAMLPDAESAKSALSGLEAVAAVLPSATLKALHIEVDPKKLTADDEEIAFQMLREKREGSSGRRAAEVKRVFDEWSGAASVGQSVQWNKLVGAEEPTAVRAIQDSDLVIVGRPRNMDGRDALHGVLFSHHLLLVMPSIIQAAPKSLFRHIAVGWKPVKQVDEAMLLSMPFLKQAERVTLLAVDQPTDSYSHDHVLRVIQQMGITSRLHPVPSRGRSIGRALIEEAHAIGADALLVGAFRHGQLVEEIFGGVTRDLLATCDLPLFMAH